MHKTQGRDINCHDSQITYRGGVIMFLFHWASVHRRYIFLSVLLMLLLTAALSGIISVTGSAADDPEKQGEKQARNNVRVPIIMYHSVLPDAGRAGDYIVTPSTLESDILYLKNNGFTPVFVSDLVGFCKGKKDLPVKPVVLTFDDGSYSILTEVLPLLEKHGVCATVAAVGRYTEAAAEEAEPSPMYSYLDPDDIKKLLASGRIELADHSYDMHSLDRRRGTLQLPTESFEDYRRALLNDTFEAQRLFKEKCGCTPEVYAFPFGLNCKAGRAVIAMCGFKAVLGVEEKVNVIEKGNADSLFMLGRFNRPSGISTEEFMLRITQNLDM